MPVPLITTSWDDGNPADLRLADMLDRHGLTGTFYIPRSIRTGVMSDDQIRGLSAKFEIGAHTLHHVFLTETDDPTARQEIAGSKAWVEDLTGRTCPMFCPPAGKFAARHLGMFSQAGFAAIRTVEFLSLAQPRPGRDGLMEMPTTLQAFPHPRSSYARNVIKRVSLCGLWRLVRHAGAAADWTTLARRLLDETVERGGVFHLWGHSWELEQADLWGPLDEVLKLLGEAGSRARCLTNGQICDNVSPLAGVR